MLAVLVGAFEREAIRPHVAGRFHDMLRAVVSHPARGESSRVGVAGNFLSIAATAKKSGTAVLTIGVSDGWNTTTVRRVPANERSTCSVARISVGWWP